MEYKRNKITGLVFWGSIVFLQMVSLDSLAVDETVPHPIDERGIMTQIGVKTTRMFRTVEVIEISKGVLNTPDITIAPGTVVIIDNKDNANHRLVFPPDHANNVASDFTSTVIQSGQLWGAEFLDPGIYPYKCTLHPEKEHGVVKVVEGE